MERQHRSPGRINYSSHSSTLRRRIIHRHPGSSTNTVNPESHHSRLSAFHRMAFPNTRRPGLVMTAFAPVRFEFGRILNVMMRADRHSTVRDKERS